MIAIMLKLCKFILYKETQINLYEKSNSNQCLTIISSIFLQMDSTLTDFRSLLLERGFPFTWNCI